MLLAVCPLLGSHQPQQRCLSGQADGGGQWCDHTEFAVGIPLVTLNGSQTLERGDSFGHTDGGYPPLGHPDWSVDPPAVTGMGLSYSCGHPDGSTPS